MFRKFALTLVSCLGLTLPGTVLLAHPHNWISVSTHFVLNDKNQLAEIKQFWEFDGIYSMITAANLKNSFENEQVGLVMMADQMKSNLAAYSYFSNLLIDGEKIQIPKADHANLVMESRPPISVMTLELDLKLDTPLDLAGKELTWSVFDPTYYISMSHKSVDDVSITSGAGIECGKELVIPQPTEETIAYAGSLDKSQRDTDGLGNEFAERVIVKCI